MTAEVCIMNRLAVVLAADSAATVTQFVGNKVEERYFKGSNKIFQLSDHNPVGLMIFDSADILRVPWEIVVKTFRTQLGEKSFNTVQEYATEFFEFLEQEARMFPPSVQDEALLDAARTAAVLLVHREKYAEDDATRLADNLKIIQERRSALSSMAYSSGLDDETLNEALAKFTEPLVEHIEAYRDTFGLGFPEEMRLLAEIGLIEVFKNPESHLSTTGLVFAGFGDHQIFPVYAEFKCCGLICGKHVAIAASNFEVTHEAPAWLSSFAQTAMSDTFSLGMSQDVYLSMMSALSERLKSFTLDIIDKTAGDATKVANLDEVVNKARREMGDAILERARKEHAYPLRRVLGVLPVDEMAELAETLINLQALKEKVTKSSETVGGPVDVAIITKSEGLVWVKRKHFFEIGLNSRYLVRQQNRLTR